TYGRRRGGETEVQILLFGRGIPFHKDFRYQDTIREMELILVGDSPHLTDFGTLNGALVFFADFLLQLNSILGLLFLMMIPEDQQSYIRSMSLCTLKNSKVNRELQTRFCILGLLLRKGAKSGNFLWSYDGTKRKGLT
ncbi:hypothetical protein AVEN_1642-1, partial [Araneus ventricosus]